MLDFLNGDMPAYIDTGLNVVDARDVARRPLLACERGRAGERYILGSENLTLAEILRKLAAITGRQAPTVRLPYAVAYCAGVCSHGVGGVTGKPPRVPLEAVRMARKKMWVSHAKAARELGYAPGPAEGALAPGGGMVSGQRILLVAAEPPRVRRVAARFVPACGSWPWPVDWARSRRNAGGRQLLAGGEWRGRRARGDAPWKRRVRQCQPEAIVSMGFCGALDPALNIGDIFVATAMDAAGRRFCRARAVIARCRISTGVSASIDHVAQTAGEKAASARRPARPPWKWRPPESPQRAAALVFPFFVYESVTDLAGQNFVQRLQQGSAFRRAFRYNKSFNVCI